MGLLWWKQPWRTWEHSCCVSTAPHSPRESGLKTTWPSRQNPRNKSQETESRLSIYQNPVEIPVVKAGSNQVKALIPGEILPHISLQRVIFRTSVSNSHLSVNRGHQKRTPSVCFWRVSTSCFHWFPKVMHACYKNINKENRKFPLQIPPIPATRQITDGFCSGSFQTSASIYIYMSVYIHILFFPTKLYSTICSHHQMTYHQSLWTYRERSVFKELLSFWLQLK